MGKIKNAMKKFLPKSIKAQNAFLQEIIAKQTQIDLKLNEEKALLNEILHGDLFRRIEWTQNEILFIEKILQYNFSSPEDQRQNSIYQNLMKIRSMLHRMKTKENYSFVRIGRHHDGGYVMIDDFPKNKIAYSIGICDDVSWDADMAARGYQVYMYDHTIEKLPEENEKFHWKKIGLGSGKEEDSQLQTLEEMMRENGHMDEYGMILKIDIEGAEWPFLETVSPEILSHFSQIVLELHGLIFRENTNQIVTGLEKINETHQLVHVHPNNYGFYVPINGKVFPELLEVTYLLKQEYQFEEIKENEFLLPLEMDEINRPYYTDIFLGEWR